MVLVLEKINNQLVGFNGIFCEHCLVSKQLPSVLHYFIASNTCESLVKLLNSNCVLEFDIVKMERLCCDCVFLASLLLVSRNKLNYTF